MYLLWTCTNPRRINGAGVYSREAFIQGNTVCIYIHTYCEYIYSYCWCVAFELLHKRGEREEGEGEEEEEKGEEGYRVSFIFHDLTIGNRDGLVTHLYYRAMI